MKKLYINCAMIGLSIIFSSLSGMEKKNHFTVTVQPIGGRIASSNTIHFALIECKNKNNENDPIAYERFKYNKETPTLPLDLFTQENRSCSINKEHYTVTFVSDRLYKENSFIPNHEYWQKILHHQ